VKNLALVLLGFVAGWLARGPYPERQAPAPLRVAPAILVPPPPDPIVERDSMVVRIARELDLDPVLALAVAYVENPGADSAAVSRAGAVGLMQVMTPAALERRGNVTAAMHRTALIVRVCGRPERIVQRACNVRVGLLIYKDYLRAYGDERRALVAYNGALAYPRAAARYVAAVRAHAERIGASQ